MAKNVCGLPGCTCAVNYIDPVCTRVDPTAPKVKVNADGVGEVVYPPGSIEGAKPVVGHVTPANGADDALLEAKRRADATLKALRQPRPGVDYTVPGPGDGAYENAKAAGLIPRDVKEALTSGRKPDLSLTSRALMVYDSRGCEYGIAKDYPRGNYLRPEPTVGDTFKAIPVYLAGNLRHIMSIIDAINAHLAKDPECKDLEGMRAAIYCPDTDPAPGKEVGPSMLPNIAGAICSLKIALEKAIAAGLLPADPGQPWSKK